jgi:hypothetical protein
MPFCRSRCPSLLLELLSLLCKLSLEEAMHTLEVSLQRLEIVLHLNKLNFQGLVLETEVILA